MFLFFQRRFNTYTKKKSNNRGSMLWFSGKQIKETSGKTEKENTLGMKPSVLG